MSTFPDVSHAPAPAMVGVSPDGPKFEQHYKQKLMLYQLFRQLEELLRSCDSHKAAYSRTGTVPASLKDDNHRLNAVKREDCNADADEVNDYYWYRMIILLQDNDENVNPPGLDAVRGLFRAVQQ